MSVREPNHLTIYSGSTAASNFEIGSSHEPNERSRERSRPAWQRARNAIKELFPDCFPDQAAEPNALLCRHAGQKLKAAELPVTQF